MTIWKITVRGNYYSLIRILIKIVRASIKSDNYADAYCMYLHYKLHTVKLLSANQH